MIRTPWRIFVLARCTCWKLDWSGGTCVSSNVAKLRNIKANWLKSHVKAIHGFILPLVQDTELPSLCSQALGIHTVLVHEAHCCGTLAVFLVEFVCSVSRWHQLANLNRELPGRWSWRWDKGCVISWSTGHDIIPLENYQPFFAGARLLGCQECQTHRIHGTMVYFKYLSFGWFVCIFIAFISEKYQIHGSYGNKAQVKLLYLEILLYVMILQWM